MAIDKRLDALQKEVDRWEMHPIPARLWAVAKILAKHGSGYAFFLDAIEAGFGEEASIARLKQLLDGIVAEVKRLDRSLEEFSGQLRNDRFIEALITAADQTQRTIEIEKIQRFAAVLGRELVSKDPDWDETQAFIRDISELGAKDIWALRILHQAEQHYLKTDMRASRAIHHEQFLHQNSLQTDEFYSRCGRLYGYGLAIPDQSSMTMRGNPEYLPFKITSRGTKLIELLAND